MRCLIAVLLSSAAFAQPALFKDLNTGPAGSAAGSGLGGLLPFGSYMLFTADDGIVGSEPRVMPLAGGTPSLLLDINPGPSGSGAGFIGTITGAAIFVADDGVRGSVLWRTDGTTANTMPVPTSPVGIGGAAQVGSEIFFFIGGDLWKLSATGVASQIAVLGHSNIQYLFGWNNTLYWCAADATHGFEPWRSGGTSGTTFMLMDIGPGAVNGCGARWTPLSGSLLLFSGTPAGGNSEALFKTDGTTAGTSLLKQFTGNIRYLTAVGSYALFGGQDATYGSELWRSDGTVGGTTLVKDIYAGTNSSFVTYIIPVGGTVVLCARDATYGYELWKTDGTNAGTTLLKDIAPGAADSSPVTYGMFLQGGLMWFIPQDPTYGRELWRSDGTAAGTVMVVDYTPGSAGTQAYMLPTPGTMFLNLTTAATGAELYKASTSSITLVADINAAPSSSAPAELVRASSKLFFSATDTSNGRELFYSDGTAAGTVMHTNLVAAAGSSNPAGLVSWNGSVVLAATGPSGREPYRAEADGGILLLADTNPAGDGNPTQFMPGPMGRLYFQVSTAAGQALWQTNGQVGGTAAVTTLGGGSFELAANNQLVYFAADSDAGRELFTYSGAGSPVLLADTAAGPASGAPQQLVLSGNRLFFTATDLDAGREPWVSDGTATGTARITDLTPGANGSTLGSPTPFLGQLFFVYNDGTHGDELWKTDGTEAGTQLVKDIEPGTGSSLPSSLTVSGSTLYFSAFDSVYGRELWKTDGTTGGTVMVKDIVVGAASGQPQKLWAYGGRIFFAAWTATTGLELWLSDGSVGGTSMVADLHPGPISSSPSSFGQAALKVFFTATTASGNELWAMSSTGLDLTPPIITPVVVGTLGNAGWYTSDITLTWDVVDDESPATPNGCGPQTVTSDTTGQMFSCSASSTGGAAMNMITLKRDATKPMLVCPAPISAEATSAAGAAVTFSPTVVDAIDPAPLLSCTPDAGTTFALGITSTQAQAVNQAGNVETCSFDVTVRDTTPPQITCPATQLRPALDATGAEVTYPLATATDAVTAQPAIGYTQASATQFPLGVTTVTATATDDAGYSSNCTFDVDVRDLTAPTLTCPEKQVETTESAFATNVVYGMATASDNVDPASALRFTYSPAEGTPLPADHTTLVSVHAIDTANNTSAECTFEVVVVCRAASCTEMPMTMPMAEAKPKSAYAWNCSSAGGLPLLPLLLAALWRGRRARRHAGTVAALLVALSLPAAAAEKLKLGYFGFKANPGVTEQEQKALSDFLQSELFALNRYTVVAGSDLSALLGLERQKQLMGCADENSSCLNEVMGALDVDRLMVGDISRIGETLVVNLSLLDARSSTALGRGSRSVKGDASAMFEEIRPLLYEVANIDPVNKSAPLKIERGFGGLMVGVRADGEVLGLGIAPSITVELSNRRFGGALVVVAKYLPGIRLEGRWYPLTFGRLRPLVAVGGVAFPYAAGLRAAIGATVRFGQIHVFADAGYERFFWVQTGGTVTYNPNALTIGLGAGWLF